MKKAAEGILNAFTKVDTFMLPEPSKAVKAGSEGRRLRVSGNDCGQAILQWMA